MKQLTEAQLLRALRRAYTQGWVDRGTFKQNLMQALPSELTSLCHEQDAKRDVTLQRFADDI